MPIARQSMRHLLVASAVLLAGTPAGAADKGIWKSCSIETFSVCTATGCSRRKPEISIFLSAYLDRGEERGAYYRCGLRLANCDRYSALVYRTGDFVIFSLPDRSVFAKLASDDRVMDVAALSDTLFVSRGRCTSGAPPPDSSLRSR